MEKCPDRDTFWKFLLPARGQVIEKNLQGVRQWGFVRQHFAIGPEENFIQVILFFGFCIVQINILQNEQAGDQPRLGQLLQPFTQPVTVGVVLPVLAESDGRQVFGQVDEKPVESDKTLFGGPRAVVRGAGPGDRVRQFR